METRARQHLEAVLAKFGREIADDARRFEAALLDACGDQFRREVAVLVAAARQGVSAELLRYQQDIPAEILLVKLTQRLQDHAGLEASAARWSVDSWALALGVVSTGQVTLPFTCPKCGGTSKVMMWLAGKNIRCPSCNVGVAVSPDGKRFSLLEPESPPPVPAAPPPPTPAPPLPPPPSPPRPPAPPPPAPPQPSGGHMPRWLMLLLGAGVVVGGYQALVAPTPVAPAPAAPMAAAPAPPAVPASAAAAERVGVAAVKAKLWSRQIGGKELAALNRGTLVTLLGNTDTRLSVRTDDGVQGWLDKSVVVSPADAERLSKLSCPQYVDQRKGEERFAALRDQARAAQGSLDGLLAAVTARSSEVPAMLDRLDASRSFTFSADAPAAVWFNWSARYAEDSKPPDHKAALDCSYAALLGDPVQFEAHHRLALNAFRIADHGSLRAIAQVVPYLAPKNATTWAIVGFAAAVEPTSNPEQVSGAFVQLLKVSGSRPGSIKWLNEFTAKSGDTRLRAAIDEAIRETDPARPPAPPDAPAQSAAAAAAAAVTGAASAAADAAAKAVEAARPATTAAPREAADKAAARALGIAPPPPMPVPPAPTSQTPLLERQQQQTEQALRRLLDRGETAMILADYAAAKVAARTALSIAPDSAEATSLLQRATRAEADLLGRVQVR